MYKWSLLLLVSIAVFQPIASFTERNLVDGRQQCCDHQPHSLYRDTRLAVHETYRINKVASGDRRLDDQRDDSYIRRYEVRRVESVPSRETDSLKRRVVSSRTGKLSQFDSRDQRGRQVFLNRLSRANNQHERHNRYSHIRITSDDTARLDNARQSRVSMEGRREQRLLSRETVNIRDNRAIHERRTNQNTRNDVAQANIRNRQTSREAESLDRRIYGTLAESRRRNVIDNTEYRSLERQVRGVSETRLPLTSRVEEKRRITNRRVAKESFEEERKVRQNLESRRVTDNRRVTRVLSEPEQARRITIIVEREVRLEPRSVFAERREGYLTSRIRENIREFRDNAKYSQRSNVAADRKQTMTVDHSLTRNADVERRQNTAVLETRLNRAVSSSEKRSSRDESRKMVRNEILRVQNVRLTTKETRETGRRFYDQQTREDRRTIPENYRLSNEIRSLSEDRVPGHLDSRENRNINIRSRDMEQLIRKEAINYRLFQRDSRTSRNGDIVENRRTAERLIERTRREARDDRALVRSVENVRTERRDTRFGNRVDARNQRFLSRTDERKNVGVLGQNSKQERDESRTRIARNNNQRIQATREIRNRETRETRNVQTAVSRDRSETRSRLVSVETARIQHFATKKATEESSVLNWQYLLYTLQGIYLCGVIVNMMKKPDNQKTRSWWGIATKAIKVD